MNILDNPVTPAEVGSALRELIDELVPGGIPHYVDVEPMQYAAANDCFVHVPERARLEGGFVVNGWALWELPGVFVEAEAHCVWLRPNGSYLDITPKKSATARVFFLPDTSLVYENRQINSVRKPVVRDQAIQDYLDSFTEEFNLLNRGDRAGQFGEITLSDREAYEYQEIQVRRANAFLMVLPRLPKLGPYVPCPCGSGRKMKWCHRVWG